MNFHVASGRVCFNLSRKGDRCIKNVREYNYREHYLDVGLAFPHRSELRLCLQVLFIFGNLIFCSEKIFGKNSKISVHPDFPS